jgi:hypothetical protein
MTIFEKFKSMNIDEYAEWFAENCLNSDDPCIQWWDKTYCQNCKSIIKDEVEYGYCELYGKCRFFENMNNVPDHKQMVRIWLDSKYDEEIISRPAILDGYYFEVGM